MSPKRKHENISCLLGRMIEAYSEIRGIEILSVASVIVKRSDLKKAYEADESYYVTNIDKVLAKEELDFEVDPPPARSCDRSRVDILCHRQAGAIRSDASP